MVLKRRVGERTYNVHQPRFIEAANGILPGEGEPCSGFLGACKWGLVCIGDGSGKYTCVKKNPSE